MCLLLKVKLCVIFPLNVKKLQNIKYSFHFRMYNIIFLLDWIALMSIKCLVFYKNSRECNDGSFNENDCTDLHVWILGRTMGGLEAEVVCHWGWDLRFQEYSMYILCYYASLLAAMLPALIVMNPCPSGTEYQINTPSINWSK